MITPSSSRLLEQGVSKPNRSDECHPNPVGRSRKGNLESGAKRTDTESEE